MLGRSMAWLFPPFICCPVPAKARCWNVEFPLRCSWCVKPRNIQILLSHGNAVRKHVLVEILVRVLVNASTEIRSFHSIKELSLALEEEIEQWKATVDEYSQWLGSFLRNSEVTEENSEWAKRIKTMGKGGAKGSSKKEKKKGRSSKAKESPNWVQFKNVLLSASEQGEAEILFEAIEEISNKVERLEKVKDSLLHLEKSGLGKDITYIAYVSDGVPEKIVLRHRKDQEFAKKFSYVADFSIQKQV
jgi:hypothetical protein